jgi:hypothetical protein
MFCIAGLVFGCKEAVGSCFHVLRSRTHFRQYRGRRVPSSCFASPISFSTVPRASGPVFIFLAPGLVFGGTKGVRTHFHVLRFRARFLRYGGRRVSISFFALPNSFSGAPMASVPVFMFCVPGLVFGGTEGVRSYFYFLRARTSFRWYRGLGLQMSEPRAS